MLLSSKVGYEAKGNEKSYLLYSNNEVLSPVKIKELGRVGQEEREGGEGEGEAGQGSIPQGNQKKSFKFISFGLKRLAPSGITLLKRVASSCCN